MVDRAAADTVEDSSRGYYEHYWTEQGYNPEREGPHPSLRSLFEAHIGRDDTCLDVGCGDAGTAGPWVTKHARSYVGADISSIAVAKAAERGFNSVRIQDASSLPFDDGQFDVVICSEVLEHLFLPHAAAAEMLRVLSESGRLIVTVPNAMHWRDRLDMLLGQWKPRGDDLGTAEPWRSPHIRFFSRRSLRRMLMAAGFRAVIVGGYADVPFLSHIPVLRHSLRPPSSPSGAHSFLGQLWPSLFALRLYAVATATDVASSTEPLDPGR
jgi:ubiquinone/menaquinone biosynthesis C-methylase UbiE